MRLADPAPGESGCLRLALDGDQVVNCGLLSQHPGPCVPFVPGNYLPPPILHLLDLAMPWIWRRCPLCDAPASSVSGDVVTSVRGVVLDWNLVQPEYQLEFRPCGCIGRQVDFEEDVRSRLVPHDAMAWLVMRKIGRGRA